MRRITQKQLENAAHALNQLTHSPLDSYTRTEKRNKANIGHYYISYAYGGVCLHRMMNESGGVDDVFRSGHEPKRELWVRIQSYIAGMTYKPTEIVFK